MTKKRKKSRLVKRRDKTFIENAIYNEIFKRDG